MNILPANKWFILRTNASGSITFQKGLFKLFNKSLNSPLTIQCNVSDSYIIQTETELEFEYSNEIEIVTLLHNPIPEDWQSLKILIRPVRNNIGSIHTNIILILGASDSGKTTLIKYLALQLPNKTDKIGIVDLDVGQNSLGIPGTINFAEFKPEGIVLAQSKYFGFLSPAGNSKNYISTIREFIQKIKSLNFNWILIDTSGYIQTNEALDINTAIISICKPQITILLGKEAMNLINRLPTRNMEYAYVSSAVEGIKRDKSPEMRRKKRDERFNKYFNEFKSREIKPEEIRCLRIFDNDQKIELTSIEEIETFIELNSSKLKNLFASICSEENIVLSFSKITLVKPDRIVFSLPEENLINPPYIIEVGGIYLKS